jgi:hypothetical protein
MNGSFKISLSTPLGTKKGTISFIDENGSVSGYIDALGSKNLFKDVKTSGDSFEFKGTLKIGYNKFDYIAKGTVTGDILKATAVTKFGNMKISGTRVG